MINKVVLFVTHKPKQCGVYEFGKNVFNVIAKSGKYDFIFAECGSLDELKEAIVKFKPGVILYNYHPTTLPWLCTKISKGLYRNNIAAIDIIQVGIIHEVTQHIADTATGYRNTFIIGDSSKRLNALFDFYIAADPTLLLKNPLVFKTGRLIPYYNGSIPAPAIMTIGSYGFATPKKGFERLVRTAHNEFDEAIIRLNMPSADFGDPDGNNAKAIASACKKIISKPGIQLEVSHQFLKDEELLDFLAGNSMNVFMYEDTGGRGISSATDYALAVKRPIAVSRCPMFRHILAAGASVCTDDTSLKEILNNGFLPLEKILAEWTPECLLWEYERIIDAIFLRAKQPFKPRMGIIKTIQSVINRFLTIPEKSFTWLRDTEAITDDDLRKIETKYEPVNIPSGKGFNTILDDQAREIYKPAETKLFEIVPMTMAKKIGRANVQQAFVFDTVYRNLKNYNQPKILCVGSYEDTASMALQRMGYQIEEIDPMVNYFLQDFFDKPTTIKQSYNIIFSTSVIEHDPDDATFIRCIESLLTPGGIAIITCDYKDGWKPGDPKPEVDARFYTKYDLETRLPSVLPECELVDIPEWNCLNPDFNYLGKYQYTFASFVVRKKVH